MRAWIYSTSFDRWLGTEVFRDVSRLLHVIATSVDIVLFSGKHTTGSQSPLLVPQLPTTLISLKPCQSNRMPPTRAQSEPTHQLILVPTLFATSKDTVEASAQLEAVVQALGEQGPYSKSGIPPTSLSKKESAATSKKAVASTTSSPAFITLGGETSALSAYLSLVPEAAASVEQLVHAGALRLGPFYLQTALDTVHPESVARNVEEGIRQSIALGGTPGIPLFTNAGQDPLQYAPLAQLVRDYGFDRIAILDRTTTQGGQLARSRTGSEGGSSYLWETASGHTVLVLTDSVGHHFSALLANIPDSGKGSGDLLTGFPQILKELIDGGLGQLHWMAIDMTQVSFAQLQKAVTTLRKEYPSLHTTVGTLEQVASSTSRTQLQKVRNSGIRGDVRATDVLAAPGRNSLGTRSARSWLKLQNSVCEKLLLTWVEPYSALTNTFSRADLRPLWLQLLDQQRAETLLGVASDNVSELETYSALRQVARSGKHLREQLLKTGGTVAAYTNLAEPHVALVETAIGPTLVSFAGLGPHPLTEPARKPSTPVRSSKAGVLSNGKITVEVAADGSFYVRGPGGRSGPHNVLISEGEQGDVRTHQGVGSSVKSTDVRGQLTTNVTDLKGEVRVVYQLDVPAGLDASRTRRSEATVPLSVETRIQLDAESDYVRVTTTVQNTASDQRLRLQFVTGVVATKHLADTGLTWEERTSGSYPLRNFVLAADGTSGVLLTGNGIPEYSATDKELYLTLLRGCGSSGAAYTPSTTSTLSAAATQEDNEEVSPEPSYYDSEFDKAAEASAATEQLTYSTADPLPTPVPPVHAALPAAESADSGTQALGKYSYSYNVVPVAGLGDITRAVHASRIADSSTQLGSVHYRPTRALLTLEGAPDEDADGRSVPGVRKPTPVQLAALRPGTAPSTFILRLTNPADKSARVRIRFGFKAETLGATDLREGDPTLLSQGAPVLHTGALLCENGSRTFLVRLAAYETGSWLFRQVSSIQSEYADEEGEDVSRLDARFTGFDAPTQKPAADTGIKPATHAASPYPKLFPVGAALLIGLLLGGLLFSLLRAPSPTTQPAPGQNTGVTVVDPTKWRAIVLTNGEMYVGHQEADGLHDVFLVSNPSVQRQSFLDLINKGGKAEPVTSFYDFPDSQVFARVTLDDSSGLAIQLNALNGKRTAPGNPTPSPTR